MHSDERANDRLPRTLRTAVLALALLAAAGAPLAADVSSFNNYRMVAVYKVTGQSIGVDPNYVIDFSARDGREYQQVWRYLAKLIPAEPLSWISRFSLFEYDDEPEWVLDAAVELRDDERSWELMVNFRDARRAIIDRDAEDLAALDATIAHEVSHLVAFNQGQLAPAGAKVRGTYVVDEGTLKADSYLNLFYAAFWKGRYPDWAGEDSRGDDAEKLYAAHPADFVSAYAATKPGEDFAESFARFVVDAAPAELAAPGETAAVRKIRFFYGFPALVALRESMRAGMGSLRGVKAVPPAAAGAAAAASPAAPAAPKTAPARPAAPVGPARPAGPAVRPDSGRR